MRQRRLTVGTSRSAWLLGGDVAVKWSNILPGCDFFLFHFIVPEAANGEAPAAASSPLRVAVKRAVIWRQRVLALIGH